jgi:hypothetical protein
MRRVPWRLREIRLSRLEESVDVQAVVFHGTRHSSVSQTETIGSQFATSGFFALHYHDGDISGGSPKPSGGRNRL